MFNKFFNQRKKFKAYVKSISKVCEVPEIYFSSNEICIVDYQSELAHSSVYDLDDVILLQYTGLLDSEGNEIYEGDIIRGQAREENGGFEYCGVVSFSTSNDFYGVVVIGSKGYSWHITQLASDVSLSHLTGKIIGNVFEHPERGGFSGSKEISN